MSKRLNKQNEYNTYLAGCTYLGMEPEYEYDELTARQFADATDDLRSRYRAMRLKATTIAVRSTTSQTVDFIERNVGEPMSHLRDRASALAKKLGKAVPVKIVRR